MSVVTGGRTSGPFIFIGTHRIKEGKLAQFKRDAQVLVDFARDHEPRLIAFNFYLNDDETEASIVQVHPDAASMLFHMQGDARDDQARS